MTQGSLKVYYFIENNINNKSITTPISMPDGFTRENFRTYNTITFFVTNGIEIKEIKLNGKYSDVSHNEYGVFFTDLNLFFIPGIQLDNGSFKYGFDISGVFIDGYITVYNDDNGENKIKIEYGQFENDTLKKYISIGDFNLPITIKIKKYNGVDGSEDSYMVQDYYDPMILNACSLINLNNRRIYDLNNYNKDGTGNFNYYGAYAYQYKENHNMKTITPYKVDQLNDQLNITLQQKNLHNFDYLSVSNPQYIPYDRFGNAPRAFVSGDRLSGYRYIMLGFLAMKYYLNNRTGYFDEYPNKPLLNNINILSFGGYTERLIDSTVSKFDNNIINILYDTKPKQNQILYLLKLLSSYFAYGFKKKLQFMDLEGLHDIQMIDYGSLNTENEDVKKQFIDLTNPLNIDCDEVSGPSAPNGSVASLDGPSAGPSMVVSLARLSGPDGSVDLGGPSGTSDDVDMTANGSILDGQLLNDEEAIELIGRQDYQTKYNIVLTNGGEDPLYKSNKTLFYIGSTSDDLYKIHVLKNTTLYQLRHHGNSSPIINIKLSNDTTIPCELKGGKRRFTTKTIKKIKKLKNKKTYKKKYNLKKIQKKIIQKTTKKKHSKNHKKTIRKNIKKKIRKTYKNKK